MFCAASAEDLAEGGGAAAEVDSGDLEALVRQQVIAAGIVPRLPPPFDEKPTCF